ncbi:MAG: glycosyltransferase family 4 protein [Desulfovibrionaceae bacterium]|nr:glycosyltransferase family 4 protein [Desulfovibrionaceae bacterium]
MAAIFYVPEAFSTQSSKLMGRNAAGESFLGGYLKYSQAKVFDLFLVNLDHKASFAAACAKYGRKEPIQVITYRNLAKLKESKVLFLSGPSLDQLAWHRSFFGSKSWSLCGITHTTCSIAVMDTLTNFITAPVQPWDALICTSNAVKKAVQTLLQAQVDYLNIRLGLKKIVLPKFPVIPLGIHTKDFIFSQEDKAQARSKLGLEDKTIVVLFLGRLSFHAKAHPLAMYQALEAASQTTGSKVVLIECGWYANPSIAQAFAEAAKRICPSVKVLNLDGRSLEQRKVAWAAADIFCSLADNIQESFGITPIEAMARGIPLVVSDWDGYKDTVRDQIDGFRIKTLVPTQGQGQDLAMHYALELEDYDRYCGNTSCFVGVDVEQATFALQKLISQADLRQKMGAYAQKRAQEKYDWSKIIPQYEQLWAWLNEERIKGQDEGSQFRAPWPARLDPYIMYQEYASKTLELDTTIALVENDYQTSLAKFQKLNSNMMVNVYYNNLLNINDLGMILKLLELNQLSCADILENFSNDKKPYIFRSIVWLFKLNLIKIVS